MAVFRRLFGLAPRKRPESSSGDRENWANLSLSVNELNLWTQVTLVLIESDKDLVTSNYPSPDNGRLGLLSTHCGRFFKMAKRLGSTSS